MIFSHSRLNLYESCPFRFYLRYVLEKAEPITKPLALGKAVHKAIEGVIQGKKRGEAIYDGLIEGDFHPEIEYHELAGLLDNAPIYPNMGETELHFQLPLSDEPDSPMLQGYIDLVVDGPVAEITDWKSNWKPYGIGETKQVALYAWAHQQKSGCSAVRGSLFFLRFPRTNNYTKYKRIIQPHEIESARTWALGLAKAILERLDVLSCFPDEVPWLFPATPSAACSHCAFKMECYKKFKKG